MEPRKYMMLKKEYLPLVLSGKKRISIRRRTRLKEGDLFYVHSGGKVWAIGEVTKVEKIRRSEISSRHAELEGMDYEQLIRELDRIYGRRDVPLYVVHFRIVKVFNPPLEIERRFYGSLSHGEIARLALKYGIEIDDEAKNILRRLAETGSIRKVAIELGGLNRRGKVRAIVRKAYEELKKKGVIS